MPIGGAAKRLKDVDHPALPPPPPPPALPLPDPFHYPFGQRLWFKQELPSQQPQSDAHSFLHSHPAFHALDSSMPLDVNVNVNHHSLLYGDGSSYGGLNIPLPDAATQNQRTIINSNSHGLQLGDYGTVFASTDHDPYHAVKASAYDQDQANTWLQHAIPRSSTTMPLCPPFTLLHD